MIIPEKKLMKLANGSDVRGVAIEGIADEPVNLTTDAANVITSGFLEFLAERTGKDKKKLRVAVGHDSRISAAALKKRYLMHLQLLVQLQLTAVWLLHRRCLWQRYFLRLRWTVPL